MTHSELYQRFQDIQSRKNNLRTEMLNYIICTLKNNDGSINSLQSTVRLDKLEEDFPFVLELAGKRMHLMGITYVKDNEVMVKVCDAQSARTHGLYLEKNSMENLEATAAFINHTLIEIGERNLYTLLVVYQTDNSRKIYPNTLKGMDDGEAWGKLMGLKNHEVRVFQMKGPKKKFMSFSEFITQMNDDGMNGYYAVQLHLKEKFL